MADEDEDYGEGGEGAATYAVNEEDEEEEEDDEEGLGLKGGRQARQPRKRYLDEDDDGSDSSSEVVVKRGKSPKDSAVGDVFQGGPTQLPFVEKYRPKDMKDVVAQDDIISTLTRLMESNQLPHLLFYGPPGTGKTSTILAVARKMYGTDKFNSMVMELNASDARGIDDVREQVVTFASTRKIFSSGMKLVILDEADNMTRDAQFALRRIIEKYAANTRFCLICNYVSKIIPALQSRCTRFRFSPLAVTNLVGRVKEICAAEHIAITENGLSALLTLGKGDMRKVLNLLEASSMQNPGAELDAPVIYAVAGKPTPKDVDDVCNALWNWDVRLTVSTLTQLHVDKGFALTDIVSAVHEDVRRRKLPPTVTAFLLTELADAEHRLAGAVDDRVQLAGLVAVFAKARKMVEDGLAAA